MSYRIKQKEILSWELRKLFERHGFRRININKFERYDLYLDHKDFLSSESMITFMDVSGKLMALKPDVTLSIVKNIPPELLSVAEKVCYQDEVYRLSWENQEYKVLSQVGVESIGPPDAFADVEIVNLALESLAFLGERYLLDLSHIDFVTGLLAESELSHSKQQEILHAIHSKGLHQLQLVLNQSGASPSFKNDILELAKISGRLSRVLPQAEKLIRNEQMQAAYEELRTLQTALMAFREDLPLHLDFSVVGNMEYYNGIAFQGYLEGIPREVLSGGRYDNLMRRMGNVNCATGFAVYLSQLEGGSKEPHYDFDVLITYSAESDPAVLLQFQQEFLAQGKSVRLEAEGEAAPISFAVHYRVVDNTLQEVPI